MTRVYVMQSGFVTANPEKLVRSKEQDLTFKDSLYVQDYRVQDTDHYFDEEVESLFTRWWKDNSLMARFEFREAVLKAALRTLSFNRSIDLLAFVSLQLQQRSVGYLHRRFLRDLLNYVLCAEPKSMDNLTYYRLLVADQTLHPEMKDSSDIERELNQFKTDGYDRRLNRIVLDWTRDIDGFSDLLATLHVIFGRRHGSTGVAPKGLQ